MKLPCLATLLILAGCIGVPAPISPAAKVTGLRVEGIDGKVVDLDRSFAKGKSVVLVFWQTWCAPCRREAPAIASASQKYRQQFDFVGVIPGTDEYVDESKVRAFIADYELSYPQVRDRDLRLTKQFKVDGTPTIVIVAPDRSITYHSHQLPADWTPFFSALRGMDDARKTAAAPDPTAR